MPNILHPESHWYHRAEMVLDERSDNEAVLFCWHWPRGTLDKRMSALELAAFILPEMVIIAPIFKEHPKVHAEFVILLNRLLTESKVELDEVIPWIRSVKYTEENDIIELSLNEKINLPIGPTYFVPIN